MISLTCKECGKTFDVSNYREKTARYCSRACSDKHTLRQPGADHIYWGKSSPALGKKWQLTQQTKYRMSLAKRGPTYPVKSTRDVHRISEKYYASHIWMYRTFGRPDTCEHCEKSGLEGRAIHWANKSGEYLQKREDWSRLCRACHVAYDAHKALLKHAKSCSKEACQKNALTTFG